MERLKEKGKNRTVEQKLIRKGDCVCVWGLEFERQQSDKSKRSSGHNKNDKVYGYSLSTNQQDVLITNK